MIANRFKPSAVSRLRTILRFEEQNLNWNLNEFTLQTNAFAYGLKEARIAPNAKALLWLDDKHTAELATTVMGCLKAGVRAVSMGQALTGGLSAKDVIERENPDLIVLSPNQRIGESRKLELLYEALPQLERAGSSRRLRMEGVPALRHVVQTGFYEKRGTVKFRDFLLYRDRELSNHAVMDYRSGYEAALAEDSSLQQINESDTVFYAGDLQNLAAVRQALLHSALSGCFVHFLSPASLKNSDLRFVNDQPADVRVHMVTDGASEQGLRDRVRREHVNYIRL